MNAFSPTGTVRDRFVGLQGESKPPGVGGDAPSDDERFEEVYLGWEIARCAQGLDSMHARGLAWLATCCLGAIRAGSTRLPLDEPRLRQALVARGAVDALPSVLSVLARARAGEPGDPVATVVGKSGERKPLVVEGSWLYPERMLRLEQRFCERLRERFARAGAGLGGRARGRAIGIVASGPPPLTTEQKRALREALTAPLALISGGPGTGKTTIVVAVLRALAWGGAPMDSIAIAAPTGKAAQRLREAIASATRGPSRDIAEAGLPLIAPVPQTLHRLLGWSPSTGRFARHANDPLPQQTVIVDEASMVDLAMMDRLLSALTHPARLVLLGDADQLPSVEAGAVFRDLCGALPAVRLTENLRVAHEPAAQRIVAASEGVNRGDLGRGFAAAVTTRRSVDELTLEGVEHLAARWSEIGERLLDRWWRRQIASFPGFVHAAARTYHLRRDRFDEADQADLRALLGMHGGARLLCATRASVEGINRRLLAVLASSSPPVSGWSRTELWPGAPIVVERNDYERQIYNGDQGVVVRVESEGDSGAEPMAVFARGDGFYCVPLVASVHVSPAFAMTVHKAQGSEFDAVGFVLPETDVPLATRELIYTAMTRARRSVLLVGTTDLLARAVGRTIERHSGIRERLEPPS